MMKREKAKIYGLFKGKLDRVCIEELFWQMPNPVASNKERINSFYFLLDIVRVKRRSSIKSEIF